MFPYGSGSEIYEMEREAYPNDLNECLEQM